MSYELKQGDCLELMKALPDGSVDAVITDPPYCSGSVSEASRTSAKGQGLRSGTIARLGWFVGDNMGTAGLVWLLRSVAVEARRLMKDTGSFLCFCDWRMVSALQPAIESAGLRFQNLVVWDKGNMGLGSGFRCQHEMILHFTNGSPEYHNRSISNVVKAKRVSAAEREHQTQKPVDLIEQLISVVTPDGGKVLDPFMGSGTTGVACANTGREFVGYEMSPDYFTIAQRRIEAAQQQHAFNLEAVTV